jgi:adenylosuccinate lyase
MPFGYSLIVVKSLIRGLNNIKPNHKKMFDELENNSYVIAEGLQTILRNIGFPNPYEVLRKITQNKENTSEDLASLKDKLYINIHPIWHEGIIEITEETISKIEELNSLNYLGMF